MPLRQLLSGAALAGLLGRLRRVGVGRLNSLGEDQLVADDAVVGEVDAHGDVVEATVDVGWACVDLLQLLADGLLESESLGLRDMNIIRRDLHSLQSLK